MRKGRCCRHKDCATTGAAGTKHLQRQLLQSTKQTAHLSSLCCVRGTQVLGSGRTRQRLRAASSSIRARTAASEPVQQHRQASIRRLARLSGVTSVWHVAGVFNHTHDPQPTPQQKLSCRPRRYKVATRVPARYPNLSEDIAALFMTMFPHSP